MCASKISGVLLLVLLCIQGMSQPEHAIHETRLFSGSYNNVPLKKVIKDLMVDYKGSYYSRAELMNQRVSLRFKNLKLQQVFKLLSTLLPIDFVYVDNTVVIQWKSLLVSGKVINRYMEPVSEVSVSNYRTKVTAVTDSRGRFVLHHVAPFDTLVVSHINCLSEKYIVHDQTKIIIRVDEKVRELEPVEVIHNGYQAIPVSQATGSFKQVNRTQVTSVPYFNVQAGFENILWGYLPALKSSSGTVRLPVASIRGRSTIYGNSQALVVIDDFPFSGDLSMINPYDIESITVAKDASSTAIYGAKATNGIIIIKTKKPILKRPLRLSYNNFFTASERPDVNYTPSIQAKDFVSLEEDLFNNRFYRPFERTNMALSPVIETLIAHKNRIISTEEKDDILDDFRRNDIRSEVKKYFYRPGFTNYNGLSLSAGVDSLAIYFSVSDGRSAFNERGIEHNRKTILLNTLLQTKRLSFTAGSFYSANRILNNFVSPPAGPPYLRLAGYEGEPLPVPYKYRGRYIDSIGRYPLLDWNYRPLQELRNADNISDYSYFTANTKIDYQIIPPLQFQALYQYGFLQQDQRIKYNLQTYYARNLINSFTQVTPNGIERAIPAASILDENVTTSHINNWRLQLDFHRKWRASELTIIAGNELRSTMSNIKSSRMYNVTSVYSKTNINYNTFFPQFLNNGIRLQIPTFNSRIDSADYCISYFGNAFYTWSKKITLSLSLRQDRSNRFGMNINRQLIPLWAAGALVHLQKFSFFPETLPYVSLRGTYGKTGNDGLQTSWSTTISQMNDQGNGLPVAYINNPGNSNLQFEEMRTINIGLDIKTRDRRVQLSLDAYRKKGTKLLGYRKANPTTGVDLVKSNTGALSGFGADVNINTVNINRGFTWETNGWVSYTTNKVQSREILLDATWKYVDPATYVPVKGYPVDAIFAFPMAGLDAIGDPVGYLEGNASKNYRGILTSSKPRYVGSATPALFGSITNTFQYKNMVLSLQVSGKFKYYFRRTSQNVNDLLQSGSMHSDYNNRWMKPGDEHYTTVPAFEIVGDDSREYFYKYSDVLVERGDHIRLQNLQLLYNGQNILRLHNKKIRLQIGINFNNLGIIWRANYKQLDPDVVAGMLPVPRSATLSVTAYF
jgi:TonB-linked SusC/RagA family outer membrane protein